MSDSVRPQRWQPTRLRRPWGSPGKNTGVGCHFLLQCMKVKSESEVSQSCPTLSDPMDCSPPGFSIHGICQARVQEWGAIAFSRMTSTSALLTTPKSLTVTKMVNQKQCSISVGKDLALFSDIFRRRQWHPTPVLLPGKSHGRRSLVGYSPWGREESDTTEQLHFPFSLSCIGEGNGNPLQCSCLENPRDGGAWWASVYGVAQNRTQLKRLSSSSSSSQLNPQNGG